MQNKTKNPNSEIFLLGLRVEYTGLEPATF